MTESKAARFVQYVGSDVSDDDVAEILRLHREWWDANHGVDIPRMQQCFPEGDNAYHMFNLQGHPYYGLAEKTALWEHYAKELDIPSDPPSQVVQLVADGNLAWLSAEVLFPLREIGESGLGTTSTGYRPTDQHRVRATECYRRDDGNGNAVWRMWHFHCSPAPDADDPRPAFGDTARSRGELVSDA